MIRFSIIVPVFCVEKYLCQCIDSVLNQEYKNFELILVDDGSPDSSPVICDEYAKKDKRICVIHKKNGGLSSARNAGLDVAKGKYVIFLDSDDWWDDRDALSKIDLKLSESSCDILIFGSKKFFMRDCNIGEIRIPKMNDKNNWVSPTEKLQVYMQNNIFIACAWDKVVRRELIEMYKLRFVEKQLSEDIEWCIKLLLINPVIEVLETNFYVYRQGNMNSITSNIGQKNVLHVYNIITKYAKHDVDEPIKHYLANQYILLLAFSNKVPFDKISVLIKDLKKYWWLVDYNWYPYVKKVAKIKWIGMRPVRKLLGVYLKCKQNF